MVIVIGLFQLIEIYNNIKFVVYNKSGYMIGGKISSFYCMLGSVFVQVIQMQFLIKVIVLDLMSLSFNEEVISAVSVMMQVCLVVILISKYLGRNKFYEGKFF